jgi:glycosyltransferase involved in cell wall biosynthesis
MSGEAPLLLHVFPTFEVGGAQMRFCAIANRFGPRWHHAVVALDGRRGAADRLGAEVPVTLLDSPCRRHGALRDLWRIRAMLSALRPSLLVTSNWGSIDWAIANRLGPRLAHLHTEDGFGPDEATGQKTRRVLARRVVLRGSTVALPSATLLAIARDTWRLPAARLRHVPNGIDLRRFAPDGPRLDLAPPGEGPVIGTVATLRAEKNIARLLRAAALLRARGLACRLVVVGEGAERPRLEALAGALGLAGVARFAGGLADPSGAYRGFEVFALSSDTEQMPLSVIEAMACARPVVATDVGDVRAMLGEAGASCVVPCDDAALADALARLLQDPALRARLGGENRARAARDFDAERMFAAWRALYDGAG